MIESTGFLTATQAAARLGVKTATLYAYVSRGLLPRHRAQDGRTSLFDPADVVRLSKRGGARRSAPSDVTVASELTLMDTTSGGLWYRGMDVLRACRQLRFEEVAWWLWTGSSDRTGPWRAEARSLAAGAQAQSSLRNVPAVDRLSLISTALAVSHPARTGTAAASDLMACVVDCLPGPHAGEGRFAVKLSRKLTSGPVSAALVRLLDAALSLVCEHGLTHPALVARLTTANGGGVASAVAAATLAARADVRTFAALQTAFATTRDEGPVRAAAALSPDAVVAACSSDPYRSGDPRAVVMLDMLADAAPNEAVVAEALASELRERTGSRPTALYAVGALAWASGMSPGSGAAIWLVAQCAGWAAHALEEQRRPTPYRPRLAYTGARPRDFMPRRTLDAVTDYLARE